ncbi:tetratricopeptide repeat protein [Psychroserpens ponticola]|uniref:Tetratricopeptide repeat protein n=1 Tax=Psychroserpens ponticola TaxID=2932268 RepID=A0ABY7S2E4_9FLAO|nr:tetratricopeptide repeat protein [Psychroserpens ponticola]WCO03569.1 tetratricopeptide repeat protein [Psychroserpens ponticola]
MREKLIYILIFGVLLYSCDFTSADEYYNQAFEYEEKGDLKKAIELLDKSIEKQSDFRPALLNRGYYKTELGNLDGGIMDYKKILEFDSDNTLALYNIGTNYQELEKPKKAIEYFTKALNTSGALTSFANSNGGTLGLRTNLDFDKLDNDNDFEIHKCKIQFSRGVNYFFTKKYDLAIIDFENSIKANYNKAESHFFLGGIYLEKAELNKACENFTLSADLGDLDAKEKIKVHCNE